MHPEKLSEFASATWHPEGPGNAPPCLGMLQEMLLPAQEMLLPAWECSPSPSPKRYSKGRSWVADGSGVGSIPGVLVCAQEMTVTHACGAPPSPSPKGSGLHRKGIQKVIKKIFMDAEMTVVNSMCLRVPRQ